MRHPIEILFVDDQWCVPERRSTIISAFGPLQRRNPPYRFHYETAEEPDHGYGPVPVLRRIAAIPELSAVVLDVMFGSLGDRLGLGILAAIREKYPVLPVFMMTSLEGETDVIERAMELGANEYLVKTPTLDELETVLRVYAQPTATESEHAIWGNSSMIRSVRARISRVAVGGSASVLITGESGSGKELVARAIHRQGPRRRGPFVDKNCAHEESDLLDDDLFGHERGAFTGADREHVGRIEAANDGVLFLDEVGTMSPRLQGKLLRVLETRQFQRLGGRETIASNFQLICATNSDPARLVQEGSLREDLYYRIKQFDIHVPPLRSRPGDVQILADLFIKRFRAGPGASYVSTGFTADALASLTGYGWPGNVRELRNVVERAVILSRDAAITRESFPPELQEGRPGTATEPTSDSAPHLLPDDPRSWPRHRVMTELRMILEAKRRIQEEKGPRWRAEFMRVMFPECRSPSTKGLRDLIRRLTKGPWGDSELRESSDAAAMLREMEE